MQQEIDVYYLRWLFAAIKHALLFQYSSCFQDPSSQGFFSWGFVSIVGAGNEWLQCTSAEGARSYVAVNHS